jgi:hypothetical protein
LGRAGQKIAFRGKALEQLIEEEEEEERERKSAGIIGFL